ncbi:MAG: NAD(P)/FAD-dependent oxidoreductase [Alphaproteobacteria bacterium]|jgi:L-2-hydroxyglutarate oxidase LhgO|nr:NAD(P)/FAD-dependent oxidoreductase [Alphaproteobacteria bacterium]
MDRVECIVVGAGVVGLAVARRLAMAGVEVVVLEAEDAVGTHTSSRNSEVIHAGIYYPKDSLKAKLCVAGKHALYEFCASHGVPHRRSGKLIAAGTAEESEILEEIRRRAAANGVDDLRPVGGSEVRAMEPEIRATAALLSPSTGIIDSHALMLAYQGAAEDHGAMIAFESRLQGAEATAEGFTLRVADGAGGETRIGTRLLVNSAGLYAQDVGRAIDGLDAATVPPRFYCKGNYFSLLGRQPFSRLIYPVPSGAGLGVHVTVDMGGRNRFGPDQEWVDAVDYDVDLGRAEVFYEAVRRYWPALPDGALQPAYSGIRPKVQKPGGHNEDFIVQGEGAHGVRGLVNLYGIESPGLTASLALADLVAGELDL